MGSDSSTAPVKITAANPKAMICVVFKRFNFQIVGINCSRHNPL